MTNLKRYFAECFGTMILVIFACGTAAAVSPIAAGSSAHLLTALAFGLVLLVLSYCLGAVSGCHVNPAVSFASFLCGGLGVWDLVGYVFSQCLGGILGGGVLYLFFGAGAFLGENLLWEGDVWRTILAETVLTCFFVFAVLAAGRGREISRFSGVIAAAALTLVHLFGIPLTGTSVNPARSLAVALYVGGESLGYVWVFFVSGILGGALAALVCRALLPGSKPVKKQAAPTRSGTPLVREGKSHES